MSSNEKYYVTTLSSEMLDRVQDVFGEDEKLREEILISIRDWINKQPHLVSSMTKCRKNRLHPSYT